MPDWDFSIRRFARFVARPARLRLSVIYAPVAARRCGISTRPSASVAGFRSAARLRPRSNAPTAAKRSGISARSAVIARGQVLEVIHQYKYRRAVWFEPFLAELLVQRSAPDLRGEHWDWIVPVPLHPARQREREFNQAERLARRLSAATGIPMNTRWLSRVIPTRTQTLLSRAERLANVRRAFALRGAPALEGERIVLVDDVFTTGATTSACARVLQEAGAGQVCVWTVARGI
jgi:ComF family protein